MAEARFERVEAVLSPPAGDLALAAEGSRLAFDGFLRVYREGANDVGAMDGDRDRPLPALAEGQPVRIRSVRTERCRTAPPARFTEAGLVRRLEELGIGRPSTWAAIVGVLRERQYVAMAGGRFVPLARGRVATAFLERFFGPWVEYGYTAGLESDLDRVAGGRLAWKGLLSGFWGDFHPALEAAGALGRPVAIAAIDDALADFLYGAGDGARRRRCPACETGELGPQGEPARPVRRLLGLAGLRLPPSAGPGQRGLHGAEAARRGARFGSPRHAAARPARLVCPEGRPCGRGEAPADVGAGRDGGRRGDARRRARPAGAAARGGEASAERRTGSRRHRTLRPVAAARDRLCGDPGR